MGSYRKRETLKLGKEKGNGSVLGSSYEKSEVKNRQRGPYAGTSGDRDSKGKGKKQIGSLSKKEGQKERSKSGSGKRVESGRFVVSVDEWARWEMASKQSAIVGRSVSPTRCGPFEHMLIGNRTLHRAPSFMLPNS